MIVTVLDISSTAKGPVHLVMTQYEYKRTRIGVALIAIGTNDSLLRNIPFHAILCSDLLSTLQAY